MKALLFITLILGTAELSIGVLIMHRMNQLELRPCNCDTLKAPQPGMALQWVPAQDFQLSIIEDTILVFNGNRLVDKMPWDDSTGIGKIIWTDSH